MSLRLAAAILAFSIFAFPGLIKAQDNQDTDNSTHKITGCLKKGPSPNLYLITDQDGKMWDVRGQGVRLASQTDHTVTLTGTIPKQPKNSTDTTPQNHLVVTSVEMVRDNCKEP